MSNVTFTANTYAGEKAGEILSLALLPKNGLAERGLVSVLPNVKHKKVLRKADIGVELVNPSATWASSSNDLVLNETVLEVVPYEVRNQLDYNALITSWEANQVAAGSLEDGGGTNDMTRFVEQRIAERVGQYNEALYMQGKAAVPEAIFTAPYLGLLGRAEASGDTKKLAANIGALAITGITTATNGVVTVASTATLEDGDFVTIIGANGNQTVNGVTINGQTFQITVLSATTFGLNAETVGVTPATSGSAQFINRTNVLGHMVQVYRNIPNQIRESVNIVVPRHVEQAYYLASANVATGSGAYYVGSRELDFLGEKLIAMNYMRNNAIAAWSPDNVFLGVDLLSDEAEIRITDQRMLTNEDVIRYKMRMKSDIQAAFYGEFVYHRPA